MRLILIFRRALPRVGAAACVALLAAACGRPGAPAAQPDGTDIRVVASFYPLFEAAREVGGGRVQAVNLTPAGAEPHDLELSPTQVDLLLDADVVLHVGGGFQPAVEAIAGRREGPTVDVLDALPPAERGGDPHVWLDPVLMAEVVGHVARAFSEADPPGAATYDANADEYRGELVALHARFDEALAECETRTFVTTHAAFSRLAARYGLDEQSLSGASPEAEPDPARIAELEPVVRTTGVVFAEPLLPADAARALARETGARVEVLDPLEGLTEEQLARGETYVTVMDRNLQALSDALGCA